MFLTEKVSEARRTKVIFIIEIQAFPNMEVFRFALSFRALIVI